MLILWSEVFSYQKDFQQFYLFIYIFLSALGLCSSVGFSLAAACALRLQWILVEEHRLQQLQNVGSEASFLGLYIQASVVVGVCLSCSSMWNLPEKGSNPCPPALVGGFLSVVPLRGLDFYFVRGTQKQILQYFVIEMF